MSAGIVGLVSTTYTRIITTLLREHAQRKMSSDVFWAYMIWGDTFYNAKKAPELHFLSDARLSSPIETHR